MELTDSVVIIFEFEICCALDVLLLWNVREIVFF